MRLVQFLSLVFCPLLLVVVDPDILSANFVNQVGSQVEIGLFKFEIKTRHLPAFRKLEYTPCMTTVPWQLRIMGELIIPSCTNPPLFVQGARPLVRLFSNCSTYDPLGICPPSKFISATIDLLHRSPGEAGCPPNSVVVSRRSRWECYSVRHFGRPFVYKLSFFSSAVSRRPTDGPPALCPFSLTRV
ncbi:hypothetical protein EDD15DRAFT_454697 [Pisolithus albus]|nr:hypothetical protein EDD15DRAFT_454697 [Pisolithus albus]